MEFEPVDWRGGYWSGNVFETKECDGVSPFVPPDPGGCRLQRALGGDPFSVFPAPLTVLPRLRVCVVAQLGMRVPRGRQTRLRCRADPAKTAPRAPPRAFTCSAQLGSTGIPR